MVKLVGGVPVPVHPEDGSFIPRIQDIEQVIGSYTKAVIINSPNNPTGVMYSEAFIAEMQSTLGTLLTESRSICEAIQHEVESSF
jgi:aspartate/methionine/tyrosine aminotransferase